MKEYSEVILQEATALFKEHGSARAASAASGIAYSTMKSRVRAAKSRGIFTKDDAPTADIVAPDLPEVYDEIEDVVMHMKKQFEKRFKREKAKKWMPFKVNMKGPIGVAWFGDPHVDDNGCNWPLLDSHLGQLEETEGLFRANIGDSTNNWGSRLMHLWANQDTSQETARELVRYLLTRGDWLIWLMGNHDLWNDGNALLKEMGAHVVPMFDWQAQFKLVFPNKREARIWAAHQFPGHSMWNTLHGPVKAAHMKDWAHLYVCGHTHNWALHKEESASREFVYWIARTRGYKFIDDHSDKLGHQSQESGASVISIFEPDAPNETRFLHCYDDFEEGVDVLNWKRAKWKETW